MKHPEVKPPPKPPCGTCGYKGTHYRPAGENAAWLCSHVECPNRRAVTAAPGDGKKAARLPA